MYLQGSISAFQFIPAARVQCPPNRQAAHLCQLWHIFYSYMPNFLVFVTFHSQGSFVQVERAAPFYTCLTPHIFSDRVSLVGFLLGVNQISSRYEPFQGSMIIVLFNIWVLPAGYSCLTTCPWIQPNLFPPENTFNQCLIINIGFKYH